MRRDVIQKINSSFLSCEKDIDIILQKLFKQSGDNGDILKRLLVANEKNCLDVDNEELQAIEKMTVKQLYDKGYIRLQPKISRGEHENDKTYIILTFDNFTQSSNPEFRDCIISFDIFCAPECWDLGGFRIRPLKIAGYIDGILNKCKLTGIGELEFLGCSEIVLNQDLCGYSLIYQAVHGTDDEIR